MNKTIITILIILTSVSCIKTLPERDNYPKLKEISNIQGTPNDSLTYYYPTSIKLDSISTNTEIDTFRLNWFSCSLQIAKEPILFNYYLGHDIYRLLWLRAFHRPVIISIHKNNNNVWLETKMLDKHPEFIVIRPDYEENELDSDSLSNLKPKRMANIILNQRKNLSIEDWAEFENRLNNASFWTAKPHIKTMGLDGSEWIIEAHLKNKYWVVERWYPKDNFRKAGEFLIEKSGLNERIY